MFLKLDWVVGKLVGVGEMCLIKMQEIYLKNSLDKGINFFDTSDTYGDGRSEKFLSEIIKDTSEKIYVTTKLGRRIRGTNYPKDITSSDGRIYR